MQERGKSVELIDRCGTPPPSMPCKKEHFIVIALVSYFFFFFKGIICIKTHLQ